MMELIDSFNLTPSQQAIFADLDLGRLKTYLEQKGWQQAHSANPNFDLFIKPTVNSDEPLELAVIKHKGFADRDRRLAEVFNALGYLAYCENELDGVVAFIKDFQALAVRPELPQRVINWQVTSTFYQSEPYIRNARQAKTFEAWGGKSRNILYGSPGDGELDLRGVIDENERDGDKNARSR